MRKKELENIIEGFESEAELLQLSLDELQKKYDELRIAVAAAYLAVTIEGKNPRHHRKIMFNHRVEWPYLWKRIDELFSVFNKQT